MKAQSASLTGTARVVPIADLVRHPDYQVRQEIDTGTVGNYANIIAAHAQAWREDPKGNAHGGTPFPPIRVAIVNGAPVVVDGWHRLAAHDKLGLPTIEAEIVEGVTDKEAQWLAAAANLQHGLQLGREDWRRAFRAFVRAGHHHVENLQGRRHPTGNKHYKSYAQITKECRLPVRKTTIHRWMRQDFPSVWRTMGEAGNGANGEGRGRDLDGLFAKHAIAALEHTVASARGVRKPATRGAIIEALKGAIGAVERQGPWTPPEASEF